MSLKSSPDYKLRSDLFSLRPEIFNCVKQYEKLLYLICKDPSKISPEWRDNVLSEYDKYLSDPECRPYLKESQKAFRALIQRRHRLKVRIGEMLQNPCVFVTLTFTDETLNNTSEESRRKYVTRFLKASGASFIGNQDFGGKNGREHYHALVEASEVDGEAWREYGAINFQRVRSTNDSTKLARYIAKLANHAVKETAKRSALIYSRRSSDSSGWKNVKLEDLPF